MSETHTKLADAEATVPLVDGNEMKTYQSPPLLGIHTKGLCPK